MIELTVAATKHLATLAEISRTGARLSEVGALPEGQELTFRAGNVQVLGAVVWSEGGQCAIAFDTPIAAAEVSRLRSLASFVASVRKS